MKIVQQYMQTTSSSEENNNWDGEKEGTKISQIKKKNSKCPLPLLKQALRNSCELLSQIVMELHETADMLLPSVYLKGEP